MRIDLVEKGNPIGHFIASKIPDAQKIRFNGQDYWIDHIRYDVDCRTYTMSVYESKQPYDTSVEGNL